MEFQDILYERERHRQDHHQPPERLQRLPRQHVRRDDQGVQQCRLRQEHRRRGAGRRGRQGLLHRRRPVARRTAAMAAAAPSACPWRKCRPPSATCPSRSSPASRLRHRRRQRAGARSATWPSRPTRRSFGQVGPKVGSVDPGFGTAFLARVVGEKKAREIWYLSRRYTAQEALAMGLANACRAARPVGRRSSQVGRGNPARRARPPSPSPSASFNVDSEMIRGLSAMAMHGLKLYYETEESARAATL